jgi:hypothetical protein
MNSNLGGRPWPDRATPNAAYPANVDGAICRNRFVDNSLSAVNHVLRLWQHSEKRPKVSQSV